jgi:lipoic acid synthetase
MENRQKPEWLKKKIDYTSMREMGHLLRSHNLHTVCEGARCPNMGECFRKQTATFMILGDVCTRNCTFCAIPGGCPAPIDLDEPNNIAEAAKTLGLKHIVITSVTRDDLSDGGALQFAKCVDALRDALPTATIELLIPDFQGNRDALDVVIKSKPEIINHNVETMPSLYPSVRPMANYQQSLNVLRYIKEQDSGIITKTGIMVGLGEKTDEVHLLFSDLVAVGCDMLTIGQYLPPSNEHIALKEYISPEEFYEYKEVAIKVGMKFVASGPYIRSSYNAIEGMEQMRGAK